MGNFWSKFKNNKVVPEDSQRLILFDDFEERISKLEEDMNSKYTKIVNMYNLEISQMKQEINQLNKNDMNTVKKIGNLRYSLEQIENKTNQIENKLNNMESGDQFLSSTEVDPLEPSLVDSVN